MAGLLLQIKLSVPLVVPLVELLREQMVAFEADSKEPRMSLDEARIFLGLFHPDYANKGVISIYAGEVPSILRSCSYFRLRLRSKELAHIPDEILERGLDYTKYEGEESRAVLCYLFLATVQTTILQNTRLAETPPTTTNPGRWAKFTGAIERFLIPPNPLVVLSKPASFTKRPRIADPDGPLWEVLVLNDPVNTMPYVTAIFEHVLGMKHEHAKFKMQLVHDAKRTEVYTGYKEVAEDCARTLQQWHLTTLMKQRG